MFALSERSWQSQSKDLIYIRDIKLEEKSTYSPFDAAVKRSIGKTKVIAPGHCDPLLLLLLVQLLLRLLRLQSSLTMNNKVSLNSKLSSPVSHPVSRAAKHHAEANSALSMQMLPFSLNMSASMYVLYMFTNLPNPRIEPFAFSFTQVRRERKKQTTHSKENKIETEKKTVKSLVMGRQSSPQKTKPPSLIQTSTSDRCFGSGRLHHDFETSNISLFIITIMTIRTMM